MLITHSAIAVAIEFLPKDKNLDLVRQNLAKAIALSAEYEKVWRSIIWVESSTSAKRRTRQKLNDIAFDVYTFLGAAFEDINVYANEQKKQNITPHPCCDHNWSRVGQFDPRNVRLLQRSSKLCVSR